MYEDRFSYDRGYFHTTESQALKEFADEYGIRIVYKNEICSRCDGEGKRALHGLVISGESLEDPEFMEEYMAGRYDTRCDECDGERIVRVPDMSQLTKHQQALWRKWMRDVRSANAESLAELRMGC